MTRDQAIDWAIKRLKAYALHPALRLSASEAHETAIALSVLTGMHWRVIRKLGAAQVYYRVEQTSESRDEYLIRLALKLGVNKHAGGSI